MAKAADLNTGLLVAIVFLLLLNSVTAYKCWSASSEGPAGAMARRSGHLVSARVAPLTATSPNGFSYGGSEQQDDNGSTGFGPYDTSKYVDGFSVDGHDSVMLVNSTTGDLSMITLREFFSGYFMRTYSTWAYWAEQEIKYNRATIDDVRSNYVSTSDTIRFDLSSVSAEFSTNLYLGWDGDNPLGSGASYASKNPAYFHLTKA